MSANDGKIKVFVKLYATLAKYAGLPAVHEAIEVEAPPGTKLEELYQRLGIPDGEVKTAFVNAKLQAPDYVLCEGDHVGIFPPVGGGKMARSRKDGLRIVHIN